jgi:iron complex transport system permease protein
MIGSGYGSRVRIPHKAVAVFRCTQADATEHKFGKALAEAIIRLRGDKSEYLPESLPQSCGSFHSADTGATNLTRHFLIKSAYFKLPSVCANKQAVFLCGGTMENNIAFHHFKKTRKRCLLTGIILGLALLLLLITAVGWGAMQISYTEVVKIIAAKLTGNEVWLLKIKPNVIAVIWDIRMPRILCGIFVGAGLAAAGVIFQSILQNPLADPYTLGISTGAAFGASIALLLNILMGLYLPVSLMALAFALFTLLIVIMISLHGDGLMRSNLIIAGIIVSSILSAGISFIKMLAGEDVSAIVFWLMGNLGSKNWGDVALIGIVVVVTLVLSLLFANDLNVMTLGNRNAASLGVNVKRIRLFYLILASCITAVCVSVCGIIGFVGLIVPHILRFWLTSDNRVLLPLSALLGGVLLCCADNVTRLISNGEIPVGVLTTLLGGPFFIYIFLKRRGGANYD